MDEGGAPEQRAPHLPPPPPPPDGGVARRRRWPWVVSWAIAVVIVAGLIVPAFVVTEAAGRPAAADFLRYGPIQPGSTSAFATTTNGGDSGPLYEQVVAPAQVESLEPNTVAISDHYDDFVGTGHPRDVRTYVSLRGERVLSFGSRINGQDFQQSDPPEVLLQAPLVKGASWSWHGTRGGGTGRSTTTIVDVADRTAVGRTFEDCLHLRVESADKDSQGTPSADLRDTWQCPDVGVIEASEVFRQGTTTIRFRSQLVETHHPGLNLRAGSTPAPPPPASFGPGQTPAVDAGHSWSLPGARLTTDRLAWSVARKADALYSPVGAGDDLVTAEDDGTVCSIDVRTGRVNWQIGLLGPIVASPVVAGGMVVVADATKSLWALDAATGRARWAVRLPDVVSATPAVMGDLIVVPTDDHAVRGLALATGVERWSTSTNSLVVAPPVVAAGLIVVGDQTGNLAALDPADGDSAWTDSSIPIFGGGTSLLGGLSAGGDTLVASTDGSAVFAFDAGSGHLRWRSQAPNTVDRPVAVAGDRVVVASQSTVEVLDGGTGKPQWRRRTDTTFAPPVVLGDTVAVLQIDNRLLTFSLADGAESTVEIGRPDGPSNQDTRLDMAWAAEALIIPTHNSGAWPFTIYQAFPAPLATGGAAAPRGVRLAGDFYGFGNAPSGQASLRGRALDAPMQNFQGSKTTGQVVESEPGGPFDSPTRVLDRSTETPAYALAAGDHVITQMGNEIVGIPLARGDRWTADGTQLLPGTVPLVVPGGGTTLVYPNPTTGLVGIDAATGEVRWGPVAKPAAGGYGTPVLLPDGKVAWGGGALTIVDPDSGRVARRNAKITSLSSLAQDEGNLFGVVPLGKSLALAGFDGTTLQPIWAHRFAPATILGAVPVAPGAGDGVVAAVDAKFVLHVYDARTGHRLWSLPLRFGPNSPPVVWNGRVYVEEPGLLEDLAQHEHRITVLDAATGAFEASWEIPGASFFPDVFVRSGERLLAAVPNGVIAIGPEER